MGVKMECNLCNSLLIDENRFLKCPNCFLKIKKNFPFEIEEKERYLAHQYDDNYKEYMIKLLNWINFDDKDVLDYGCGQHPILKEAFPLGNFVNYDYYFYPSKGYLNIKYDIILLVEVIEHIKDVKGTLEEIISLLKPDGRIYIHTKMYDDSINFESWWYQRDITHISFFNIKTFEFIANKYNLKLEEINDFIVLKKI